MEESELCPKTKVAHTKKAHLLEYVLSSQLNDRRIRTEKVLHCKRGNLHDITNVKTKDPLVLVQVAKYIFHVCVSYVEIYVSTA